MIIITATVFFLERGFCSVEITNTSEIYGSYEWEEAEIGQNVTTECMFGSLNDMGIAHRVCSGPMWEEPVYSNCFTENTRRFQDIGIMIVSCR